MSLVAVNEVIDRVLEDREFCQRLAKNPEQPLAGYDLGQSHLNR